MIDLFNDESGKVKFGRFEMKFFRTEEGDDFLVVRENGSDAIINFSTVVASEVRPGESSLYMTRTSGSGFRINCDSHEDACKINNIIGNLMMLTQGNSAGLFDLERFVSTNTEKHKCECKNCGCDKDVDDEKDFIEFMDGFFEHMKNKLKENK